MDASISVATLDSADALHRVSMDALAAIGDDRLVLPASALAESLVGAHRRGDAGPARQIFEQLGTEVAPLSEQMADEAARLRARHPSLRLSDALVIATARVLDADRLLTGDRRWAGIWERIEVLEPDP